MIPLGILASSLAAGGPPPTLPSSPESQWQAASAASSGNWTHTVGSAVGVGRLVVCSFVAIDDTGLTNTVTDSQSNTWTVTAGYAAASTITRGVIAYAVLTTALTTSDTITLVAVSSMTRAAVDVTVWDWTHATTAQGAWRPDSDTTQESDSADVSARAVVVGCFALSNPGRTTTVGSGWTGTTKVETTNGSGDRAVQGAYRTVDPSATGLIYDVGLSTSGSGTASWVAFVE